MYTRILVPLDGSGLAEQVLPHIRLLGKGFGCPVELVRVVEEVPSDAAYVVRGVPAEVLARRVHAAAKRYLEGVAVPLREDGVTAGTMVRRGDPATHIVTEAGKEPGTVVAMTTHGRSGMTRWLLGSVTDKVLHATTSPLLVIRCVAEEAGTADVKLKAAIVALDGSALAEQALPHVVALSKAMALERVVLARAAPSAGDYYQYSDYSVWPRADFSQQVDAEAASYLSRVGQGLRQQGVASVEERLLHGSPGAAIVDLARETQGSLVVMTTHGRSGLGRWLLGSVADRVVRHAGVPVLVVRATEAS
ncbi:MAG: universal stress protein [Chloroflexi bacterium]|nr:universal stress protein [Chloroflexota bacterium]